jgi:hypothetical protein
MDELAFATIVDFLGGVEIENTRVQGERVVSFLRSLEGQPQSLLEAQGTILEALVEQASALETPMEITTLTELIPEHVYLSEELPTAVGRLAPFMPPKPDSVYILLEGPD